MRFINYITLKCANNSEILQKNTFQAVLAMDAYNMKSFVMFGYREIKLNSIRRAMMGIQAVKSAFNYNYKGDIFKLAQVPGFGTCKNKFQPDIKNSDIQFNTLIIPLR